MKIKKTVVIGLVVSTFAAGLAAEVAQTYNISSFHLSFKQGPTLLKIKSGGEVIAEVRLLKPAQLDINGVEGPQTANNLRTATLRTGAGGYIEIAPDGLSPWRISGAGLQVETVDLKAENR